MSARKAKQRKIQEQAKTLQDLLCIVDAAVECMDLDLLQEARKDLLDRHGRYEAAAPILRGSYDPTKGDDVKLKVETINAVINLLTVRKEGREKARKLEERRAATNKVRAELLATLHEAGKEEFDGLEQSAGTVVKSLRDC